MPKDVEEKAKKRANALGLSGRRWDAYVYGALRKTGWKPSKESKPKKK